MKEQSDKRGEAEMEQAFAKWTRTVTHEEYAYAYNAFKAGALWQTTRSHARQSDWSKPENTAAAPHVPNGQINVLAPGERSSGEIAGYRNDDAPLARDVQTRPTSQERVSNPVEDTTFAPSTTPRNALVAEIEDELNRPKVGAEGVWYCVADDKPCPKDEGCSAGHCDKYGQPAVEKVRRLARLANRAAEALKSSALSATPRITTLPLLQRLRKQRDEVRAALAVAFRHVDSVSHGKDHALIKAALDSAPSYEQQLRNIAEGIGMTYEDLIEAMNNRADGTAEKTEAYYRDAGALRPGKE